MRKMLFFFFSDPFLLRCLATAAADSGRDSQEKLEENRRQKNIRISSGLYKFILPPFPFPFRVYNNMCIWQAGRQYNMYNIRYMRMSVRLSPIISPNTNNIRSRLVSSRLVGIRISVFLSWRSNDNNSYLLSKAPCALSYFFIVFLLCFFSFFFMFDECQWE